MLAFIQMLLVIQTGPLFHIKYENKFKTTGLNMYDESFKEFLDYLYVLEGLYPSIIAI